MALPLGVIWFAIGLVCVLIAALTGHPDRAVGGGAGCLLLGSTGLGVAWHHRRKRALDR